MKQITLLGLGTMGNGMARQLLKAGFDLAVYNRTAESPREAVREADVVLSMVSNDKASRAVWLGEKGALAGAKEGAVLVECSTLSPSWVRELAGLAGGRGFSFLDVPVNGSRDAAESGTLLLLVGGSVETMEQIRPVLEAIGRQIIHLGPTGSGTVMKLARNMLVAVQTVAIAEALTLTERARLDMAQVAEVLLNDGGLSNGVMKRNVSAMMERTYSNPAFLLQHMRKDVNYALHLANELGTALPTAAITHEVYQLAGNLGHNGEDFSAVSEVLRQPAANQ